MHGKTTITKKKKAQQYLYEPPGLTLKGSRAMAEMVNRRSTNAEALDQPKKTIWDLL
jgi:hypothetical protein